VHRTIASGNPLLHSSPIRRLKQRIHSRTFQVRYSSGPVLDGGRSVSYQSNLLGVFTNHAVSFGKRRSICYLSLVL
jgi:hypothetical protein